MTPMFSKLAQTGRAAVIALALGASVVTAAPALAQSGEPQLNFQLELGNGGGGAQFQMAPGGNPQGRVAVPDDGGFDPSYWCLSDRDIRRGLGQYGFREVRVVRELRRERVEVVARYGSRYYSMRVDRCSGKVDQVKRLRRPGGGFGLQFNFGN